MKKLALVFLVILLFSFCGTEQSKVDIIIEDGVEVVLNHLEPYEVKGEPSNLVLEEEIRVDFEDEKFAELGMSDILGFDVDSEGFVYLLAKETSENFIYRFDKDGNFVDSFGRRGQGPGELEEPMYLRINESDELIVTDGIRSRIVYFNTHGELLREVEFTQRLYIATQLENESILEMRQIFNPNTGYVQYPIVISNVDLELTKELQQGQKIPNWIRAPEINGLNIIHKFYVWSISNGHIFVDNAENGYEFLVFDVEGRLLRKIKKEYVPQEVPQELKEILLSIFDQPHLQENNVKEKVFFPKHMPPYQYFFTDDESRLYVMTCEKGQGANEYVYDIFNPDGFFIGRTILDNFGVAIMSAIPFPLPAVAKKNKLYHLRGKETGYNELVISQMIWQ